MMLSESQERMLIILEDNKEKDAKDSNKSKKKDKGSTKVSNEK